MYQLGIQTHCPRRRSRNCLRPLSRDSIQFRKDEQLAVINLDAHFDLRPTTKPVPTLEQVFVKWLIMRKKKVRTSLTSSWGSKSIITTFSSLITLLKHLALIFLTGQDLFQMSHQSHSGSNRSILENQTAIYLSIDMDCFAVGSAPGVSAIQSLVSIPN